MSHCHNYYMKNYIVGASTGFGQKGEIYSNPYKSMKQQEFILL